MGMSEERELGFTFSSVKRRKNPCASISKESIGVSSSVHSIQMDKQFEFRSCTRSLEDYDLALLTNNFLN